MGEKRDNCVRRYCLIRCADNIDCMFSFVTDFSPLTMQGRLSALCSLFGRATGQ